MVLMIMIWYIYDYIVEYVMAKDSEEYVNPMVNTADGS